MEPGVLSPWLMTHQAFYLHFVPGFHGFALVPSPTVKFTRESNAVEFCKSLIIKLEPVW